MKRRLSMSISSLHPLSSKLSLMLSHLILGSKARWWESHTLDKETCKKLILFSSIRPSQLNWKCTNSSSIWNATNLAKNLKKHCIAVIQSNCLMLNGAASGLAKLTLWHVQLLVSSLVGDWDFKWKFLTISNLTRKPSNKQSPGSKTLSKRRCKTLVILTTRQWPKINQD